mmetsp:Transcript_12929/g.26411  ORF Transcript_12929/g.26411 Transcript_12929/m.26411 type:complete len:99 (+) Transcript_12929:1357-1653(+)
MLRKCHGTAMTPENAYFRKDTLRLDMLPQGTLRKHPWVICDRSRMQQHRDLLVSGAFYPPSGRQETINSSMQETVDGPCSELQGVSAHLLGRAQNIVP